MLKIETNLRRYDDAWLQKALAALPPTWRARAERYKPFASRLQSTVAYTLLMQILQEDFGVTSLPAITTDTYGKPRFVDSPLHFSISHCKTAAAVIVEEHPVGIDIQDILEDISPALAARIAAPRSPEDMSPRDLTALWTKKEASAKLEGKGLKLGLEKLPLGDHIIETRESGLYIFSISHDIN